MSGPGVLFKFIFVRAFFNFLRQKSVSKSVLSVSFSDFAYYKKIGLVSSAMSVLLCKCFCNWFFGVCVCVRSRHLLLLPARKGHIVSIYRSGQRLNPCMMDLVSENGSLRVWLTKKWLRWFFKECSSVFLCMYLRCSCNCFEKIMVSYSVTLSNAFS